MQTPLQVTDLTKVQAADLQAIWIELGSPLCEHRRIDLERSEDGYLTGNYHCRECGETIVRTYRVPPFSNAPLID